MVVCKRYIKKTVVILLCFIFAFSAVCVSSVSAEESANSISKMAVNESDNTYFNYYSNITDLDVTSNDIVLNAASQLQLFDGKDAIVYGDSKTSENYNFSVSNGGVYALKINYHTVNSDASSIMLDIKIDGSYLYEELSRVEIPRFYEDDIENKEFLVDEDGNDIRPSQREVYDWNEVYLKDTSGLYSEPYLFNLSEGNHTLTLSTSNAIAVSQLCFCNYKSGVTYKEYFEDVSSKNSKVGSYRQEAEHATIKNSPSLYPTYNNTDASMVPQSSSSIMLNSIGGSNWATTGYMISWKLDIKKAGLYTIALRVNQSYNESGYSYRKLTINGVCPFDEVSSIAFPYSTDWYIKTLGDDKPYVFYLEPDDVLSLEVVVDDKSAEMARDINNVMLEMNSLYRKMLVITGPDVDIYRDYALDTQIPELIDSLKHSEKQLDKISKAMSEQNGSGSSLSTVKQVKSVIHTMIEESYALQEYVSSFADSITNLGSLIQTIGLQGLEIDSFFFQEQNTALQNTTVSFFKKLGFEVSRFLNSFAKEYKDKNTSDDSLLVWISTGRDQLQLINRMIEGYYKEKSKCDISLNLVDTGATLIKATLAGKGPDVALIIPEETPINLAMRGALVDLNQFDFGSLKDEFYSSAFTPYYYQDGLYAIPETQNFDVVFYRTDIFKELGINPPDTWEDFYDILEMLQRNNLQVGIPEIDTVNAGVSTGIVTFQKFLLQNGGSFYNDDLSKTAFDTNIAKDAFYNWVQLYKKYGLDRSYDFYNRFRSGEMPMAIQTLLSYNQIYSAAPEIRGLWSIAVIPGTKDNNGEVNHTQAATGTACIMLNSAVNKGLGEQAFDFMKWWTSSETQAMYAKELEATMGIAGRYYPANKVAFEQIAWSKKEAQVILDSWAEVENIPQVPGNYVLKRDLTSAFRNALNDIELPERQLETYNASINDEISRKRKEFSLE